MTLLNVGFGNMVVAERVIAIVAPDSSPSRRLKEESKNQNKLIDATAGRKTKTFIIIDSEHLVLSAINPETIAQRLKKGD